jgi:hypothetical protein
MDRPDPTAEKWIKTSQRAEKAKPWDPTPGDANHFVRKTAAAINTAKPRIDTGLPRTAQRWKGRNFNTIARTFDTALARKESQQVQRNVAARADAAPTAQAHANARPALLMRRVPSARAASPRAAARPLSAGALTVQESFDARTWGLPPPLLAGPPARRPALRPGGIALHADRVLPPAGRRPAAGAATDLLRELGAAPTPKGARYGVKGVARDDMTARGLTVPLTFRRPASGAATPRSRSGSRRRSRSGSRGRSRSAGRGRGHSRSGSRGSARSHSRGREWARAGRAPRARSADVAASGGVGGGLVGPDAPVARRGVSADRGGGGGGGGGWLEARIEGYCLAVKEKALDYVIRRAL